MSLKGVSAEEHLEIRHKVGKPMVWVAVISICMLFGGLTSAYILRSGDPGWIKITMPTQFFISAVVLALSSLTLIFGVWSAKNDKHLGQKIGVLMTLVLGLIFVWSQFQGWGSLVAQGIVFGGKQSHQSGQFLYVLSLAHIVHVFGGIMVLIYVSIKSLLNKYHSKNFLGLQLCSIYWHFLDILWIYLLAFMYLSN